jgi:hypothetical protein
VLIFRATEIIFNGAQTRDFFWHCSLCGCKFPAKTNNFGLGADFLSYIVSELKKPPSTGHGFGVFVFLKSLSGFKK